MILQPHSWAYVLKGNAINLLKKYLHSCAFLQHQSPQPRNESKFKCPSTEERAQKKKKGVAHTHTHTVDYDSAIK